MGRMGRHRGSTTLGGLCLRAAQEHGAAIAVDDGTEALSYAELGRRARRVAAALMSAGVRPGDRVLLSAANSVGWVAAAFGVSLAGATILPVNHRLAAAERDRVVEELAPVAVISDELAQPPAADAVPVLALGELLCWDRDPVALPVVTPDMPALVMQTSGTTGSTKAVPMRHGPLLDLYADLSRRIGLTATDVLLGPVPLAHGFGLFGVLLDGLLAGARVRLVRRYDRDTIADLVVDEGVTALFAPPTVYHDLLSSGRTDIGSSCRIALTGGAEVSLPGFLATCDTLGVRHRMVGYGTTESYGAIAFGEVTEQRHEPLPVLTPLPGVEVRVTDAAGAPVGPGVAGEVQVRGASVVAGPSGWLGTGDLGQLDDDRRLTVRSRLADTVVVSGFNVSPAEVEDVLREVPGVADAVVVGVPHERRGETLVGCVVMRPGSRFDRGALHDACRARLAPYKVPTELLELSDFPTTHTGKRSRSALRELVLRRASEQEVR